MNETRKCDPALGQKVNEHLISLGLETPMKRENFDSEFAIKKIQGHFENIMNDLRLDLNDDSLCDTPKRVAQMYVNEIFWGMDYDKFPKCTKAIGSICVDRIQNEQ